MQIEFVLLILSLLFFVSIIADKIGYRFGVPALLLFLTVGMLFGSGGVGALFGGDGIQIETSAAQALSTLALCIILFSGGLDTKLVDVKSVLWPGVTLATLGVLLTCVVTGVITYFIFGWLNALAGISIWMALLMAATLSSTDSASVFSIMRTNSIGLKHGLRPLLELESGANDPMAYVLTTTMIGIVLSQSQQVMVLPIIQTIVIQLVMGTVLGFVGALPVYGGSLIRRDTVASKAYNVVIGSCGTLSSICGRDVFTVYVYRKGITAVQVILGYPNTVLDRYTCPVISGYTVE